MKTLLAMLLLVTMASYSDAQDIKNFYEFTVTDIDGKKYHLAQLEGKKVLIVNVASRCGNTPQYSQLEDLYKEYGGSNFVILGFPANNFLGQEPGTNEEIKTFCQVSYGVTFPMMSKISVKGDDIAPLYKWLTTKSENGVLDAPVTWNFQKFLIDEKGRLVASIPPKEPPMSSRILNWLNGDPLDTPRK